MTLALAVASCSEEQKRRRRGGNDAGEAGAESTAGAGAPGSGGVGSGGSGTGATGSGATSSGATSSGATGSGAAGSGAAGATGSGATGGVAGAGGEGGDGPAPGGSSSGGSGQCSGDECKTCGDGALQAGEECDDGDTEDDDGCSSECTVESGHTCTGAVCEGGRPCVLRLPATFRDFNDVGAVDGHPDFEPGYSNFDAIQGLVESTLDEDGKPVATETATLYGNIASRESFAEWYRDGAPGSVPIPGEIVLWDDGAGGFVNRWGAGGEQWIGYPDTTNFTFCAYGCAECGTPPPGFVCLEQCVPLGSFACIIGEVRYDGNPLFFPIDSSPDVLTGTRGEGRIPEAYGYVGWPWESDVASALGIGTPVQTSTAPFPSAAHNFSFTTEVRFWIRYDDTRTQTLSFAGDDDVWVFLNGRLAIDLGGWHIPLEAELDLAGGVVTSYTTTSVSSPASTVVTQQEPVSTFKLEPGGIYEVAVFHAERQAEGSSFRLGLRGFDVSRSLCAPN